MTWLKSKRLVSFLVGVILYVVLIYTTRFSPMEIAGSITMIIGIYVTSETFRKSEKSN
ncbi:MAG: hypothetical protein ACYDEX_19120 [Mobilitalea sp.]